MFCFLGLWFGTLVRLFRSNHSLLLENLALRQQPVVLKRRHPRPKLDLFDKLFWLLVRRCWSSWKQALLVVTPPRFRDGQPRNGNQWCHPPHWSLARTGERREQTWRHYPKMPRAPQPWHWKPVAGQRSDRSLASQDSIFRSSGPKPTPE